MPRDAAHAGAGKEKETPRMIVFGSASWLSDENLSGRQGTTGTELILSCISWLRDKSATTGITVEAKKRKEYKLGIEPQGINRLKFLPSVLMMLAVLVLGTGVWIVRRR